MTTANTSGANGEQSTSGPESGFVVKDDGSWPAGSHIEGADAAPLARQPAADAKAAEKAAAAADAEIVAQQQLDEKAAANEERTVAEHADDFAFEVPEDLQAFEQQFLRPDPETGEDPMVSWFKRAAVDLKLDKAVANALYTGFLKQGATTQPGPSALDVQAEKALLGPDAQKIIDEAASYANGMFKRGAFDQDMMDEYRITAASANGLRMLMAIRESAGHSVPSIDTASPGPVKLTAGQSSAEQSAAFEEAVAELESAFARGEISETIYTSRWNRLQRDFDKAYGTHGAGSSIVVNP